MVIPLKDNVVKVSISKTIPDTFQLTINGETIDKPFGPGIDLHITPLEIQFHPQENISDKSVAEIPRDRSSGPDYKGFPNPEKIHFEQSPQPKIISKEAQRENNKSQQTTKSNRTVLLHDKPSATQTGSSSSTSAPTSNIFPEAKTTENIRNAIIVDSSIQWALQIHVTDNASYPLKYFLNWFGV